MRSPGCQVGDPPPKVGEPTGPVEFEDILGEILERLATRPADDRDGQGDAGIGTESPDLAVWQDRQLIAVVRTGREGSPVVTRFDG